MTHAPHVRVKRLSPAKPAADADLLAALQEFNGLLKRHVFGSLEHLEVVKGLTSHLQRLQREDAVTSYELGAFTPDTVHVHVFVPMEDFTLEKRQRIRRELRTIGRGHGLYVDSHIQPDVDCGRTE